MTIEPIFEVQFRQGSYGFRPGRGCKDAAHGRSTGSSRKVSSITRLVILCRTEEEAAASLREIEAWTAANGLTLNPDKTRIGDCRQWGQGFDFLGYRFEAGRRLVRTKSLKAFRDKVREKTKRWPNAFFANLGLFTFTTALAQARRSR